MFRQFNEKNAMPIATMTSKGQVTLPATVRASLGVKAGDRVIFVQVRPGRFELIVVTQPVTTLKGMIRKPVAKVTVEGMNEAIANRRVKAKVSTV